MPIYLYQHPHTEEIIEVFQTMSEEHVYHDDSGLQWKRVFSSPCATVKGKPLDLRSKKDSELYHNVYKKRYEYNKKKGKIDKNGNER